MLIELWRKLSEPYQFSDQSEGFVNSTPNPWDELTRMKWLAVGEAVNLENRLRAENPEDDSYVGVRTIRDVVKRRYTEILGYEVIHRKKVTTVASKNVTVSRYRLGE